MRKAIEISDDIILNDSHFPLSSSHIEAISLGFGFIPSRRPDPKKLDADLEALRRRLNLRLHWNLMPNRGPSSSLVSTIIKSTWNPPNYLANNNPAWSSLISSINNIHLPPRAGANIKPHVTLAWKQLINDPAHFVIPADKGGRAVIISQSDYIKEADRQLNDTTVYKEMTHQEALEGVRQVNQQKAALIGRLVSEGSISSTEASRLRNAEGTICPIYFLPKIHQPKRTDTGTFKGRPIAGNTKGHMKPLDAFIATLTAPLLPLIPGTIQDTRGLLRGLGELQDLPDHATLFSADVESLYPSMDLDESIDATTHQYHINRGHLVALAKRDEKLPPPSTLLFRDILRTVLKNHYFHFREQRWFLQIQGTAMGASVSVLLANCFMYNRTRYLIDNPPPNLLYMTRYIDDIIGVWTGPVEEIQPIFNETRGRGIELTFVIGGRELIALDVSIFFTSDGRLGTKLYRKPTDGHLFVHWSSAHPYHLKISIPYAQLIRLRRNCSEDDDYEQEAALLLQRFAKRGYPAHILSRAYDRAAKLRYEDLIQDQPTAPRDDHVTLVVDYNPDSADQIRKLCSKAYNEILQQGLVTQRTRPPFPLKPPRIAYRAGRSLGSAIGPIFKNASRLQKAAVSLAQGPLLCGTR